MKNCVTGGQNLIMTQLKVKVIPNSSKFKIELTGTYPKIYLQNPARNGKANLELIKKLSKIFNKKIIIISGKNSRIKLLEIKEEQEEILKKFREICSGSK